MPSPQSTSKDQLVFTSKPFYPVARFHPEMDVIQYLNEDCSYRAERVDGTLTLFWHPHEAKLVGIALKGFRFLFQRLKELNLASDTDFLPMVTAIQTALEMGAAQQIMDADQASRKQRYADAKKFAATVTVPPEELRIAA